MGSFRSQSIYYLAAAKMLAVLKVDWEIQTLHIPIEDSAIVVIVYLTRLEILLTDVIIRTSQNTA